MCYKERRTFQADFQRLTGSPLDNDSMENIIGILKHDCLNIAKPTTHQKACDLVHDCIHFYQDRYVGFQNIM